MSTSTAELAPGPYYLRGTSRGTGKVTVEDGTIVGYSSNDNPKVSVRVALDNGLTEVRTVMVHDLTPWDEHEELAALREETQAETERIRQMNLAARVAIVEQFEDETSFIVQSDYQWSLADITGPYGWTEAQRDAVSVALSSLGELRYENAWRVYTGAELRKALEGEEFYGPEAITEFIDREVIAPFLPDRWFEEE